MKQAITDQNFRYNGMRLCEHLIENLNLRNAKGSFKEQLLKRYVLAVFSRVIELLNLTEQIMPSGVEENT